MFKAKLSIKKLFLFLIPEIVLNSMTICCLMDRILFLMVKTLNEMIDMLIMTLLSIKMQFTYSQRNIKFLSLVYRMPMEFSDGSGDLI